jgi:hypothetical protein
MQDRFAYGLNPEKCAVASAYLCDPVTAHLEFMLVKSQYQATTGREAGKGNIFFQIRQAFPQGEVTPEQANAIGYETAMRWTKGNFQFIVCTHTDKGHLHNHIYYNSTAYDRSRKYHNFLGSAFAVRRLSDRVCLEHGLSVIENPRQHSKGDYRHYGEWLGADAPLTFQQRLTAAIDAALSEQPKDFAAFLAAMEAAGFEHKHTRGALSFRCPAHGQDRFTRLRASTLGEGYGLEDILAAIEGRAPLPAGQSRAEPGLTSARSSRPVNLIIDIQAKLREGKGPAYERWAKVYNLKMMAAALQYLQENNLLAYGDLAAKADGAVDRFHALAGEIQTVEAAIARNGELKAAMIDYAKTRPVFDGYKAARYSKQYLAAHEADIATHRAARATFTRLLAGEKLPKMDALRAEWQRLTAEKKALYAKYRAAQKDMREVIAVRSNVDHLLGVTGGQRDREAERS